MLAFFNLSWLVADGLLIKDGKLTGTVVLCNYEL
jgi:hypothetical protein